MSRPALDWDKLARYLAGESPPEEAADVRRWLQEHPSDSQVIAALDAATKRVAPQRQIDVEGALRQLKTRAAEPAPSPTARSAPSQWRAERILRRFEVIAAAAVIVIAVGIFVVRRSKGPLDDRPVVAARTFETPVGKRDSVPLADGSWILLGPGSRAVVRDREVELQGQAYFSVAHDPARPFTVRAGAVVIRDLGTQFSVQTDSTQPARVVVKEGLVQVAHLRDSVTLAPGDIAVVDSSGRVRADRGAATSDDLAWTSGSLIFRDAPLTQLVGDLRRWYGVELRVTDSALLRRHVTTRPFVNEPPERVIETIALMLGARVERRGDTAILSRNPLPARPRR